MRLIALNADCSVGRVDGIAVERRTIQKTSLLALDDIPMFVKLYLPDRLRTFKSDYFGEVISYVLGKRLDVPMAPLAVCWAGTSDAMPPALMQALSVPSDVAWAGLWGTEMITSLNKPPYEGFEQKERALTDLLTNVAYCRIAAFDLFVANTDDRLGNLLLGDKAAAAFDNERAFGGIIDWSQLPSVTDVVPPHAFPSSSSGREMFRDNVCPELERICLGFQKVRRDIEEELSAFVEPDWVQQALRFLDCRARSLMGVVAQRLGG